MSGSTLRLTYRGRQSVVQLSDSTATLQQLSEAIQKEFQVDLEAQKLLVGGRVILPAEEPELSLKNAGEGHSFLHRHRLSSAPLLCSPHCLTACSHCLSHSPLMYHLAMACPGIEAGAKIMVLSQPGKEEIARLEVPDQRIRGFDEELVAASRRRQSHVSASSPPAGEGLSVLSAWSQTWHACVVVVGWSLLTAVSCAGSYTFQHYEAWNLPGLQPPPAEALKLLHSLAADRGIIAIMTNHRQAGLSMQTALLGALTCPARAQTCRASLMRVSSVPACRWSVGKLSEMPPEGKVGVSPVCILGVNINGGQEISLRLRTDDLRGFRRYDRTRETLIHELAHMVFSEHDNNFKELNSQLLHEAAAHDWTKAARALAGDVATFDGDWDFSADVSASQPARHRLGGGLHSVDAQAAAARAALNRAGALSASASGPEAQSVGPSAVKDQQHDSIEGLGHLDDTTEQLEREMRKLGTPTAAQGRSSSPFTQHAPPSPEGWSDRDNHPRSGKSPEEDSIPTEQSSPAAADSSPAPVEAAVQSVVSSASPERAKAALHSVSKILQVCRIMLGIIFDCLPQYFNVTLPHCIKAVIPWIVEITDD